MQLEVKISAVKCTKCGEVIYSRAQHDYRICSCGQSGIDGGPKFIDSDMDFGYRRIKGNPEPVEVTLTDFYNIEEARVMLYQDWNKNINKYGRIK